MSKEVKKPRIRFEGFTDAWEQRKLSEVADIIGGGTPSTGVAEYWDGDIDWYAPAEINDQIYVDCSERKITRLGLENSSAKILPANKTVLFTSRAGIGKTAILRHDGATNQGFQSMVLNDETNPYFVFSMSSIIKEKAERVAAGSTFAEISGKMLGNLEFWFPSKAEQDKIGGYFENLDHLITLHQRKCVKLQKIKKSMLQKMFPQNGSLFPEIRFEGFTDAWEQRKLGDVVDVQSGRDYKHLSEGDIPVYGTGGYMLSVSEALSYNQDAIGIGRKGTIDKPYVLRAPFWTVDTLFYALPRDKYNLSFLNCIFQNVDWKKKDESTGVPSLSKTTINDVDINVPNETEQKIIGLYFDNLDHLITLHQRKLDKLNNIKKAMLEKMFV